MAVTVVSRGGWWEHYRTMTRKRNDLRAADNGGLDSYMRIARMLCQRHHSAILFQATSALVKSSAMPALHACGVTSFTISRASTLSSGNAAKSVDCNHAFRSCRVGCIPFVGRKSNFSPACINILKCHRRMSAAVSEAITDPSGRHTL